MEKLIVSSALLFSIVSAQKTNAQTTISISTNGGLDTVIYNNLPYYIKNLKANISIVNNKEKGELKIEVKKINSQLKNDSISEAQAEQRKRAAADKRAQNINDITAIINANISLLQRNKDDNDRSYYARLDFLKVPKNPVVEKDSAVKAKTPKRITRTHSVFNLAFGFNNAIVDNNLSNNSPYKIGGSNFFELGYEFKTAIFKSGFMRINYGLDLQINGLKPSKNNYFVQYDKQTNLEKYPYNLQKCKLQTDNIVIPLHFEFGPANKAYYAKNFKIGLGGYAGLRFRSLQKIEYKDEGRFYKIKTKDDYNTNDFIYGLSAYIGYDWISLYAKYDINPIFQDNLIPENNVSIGLQFTIGGNGDK